MEFILTEETVRCSHPNQPIVNLSEILLPEILPLGNGNDVTRAPFTLRRYRANVRVVDYFPHRIEDFAVARQTSEYDLLSNHSDGEDTDADEDHHHGHPGRGAITVWEWRFALQVEDAMAKENGDRLWLIVDNSSAQGLLGLENDAAK
jgi:protection-of-telomeres protein 1